MKAKQNKKEKKGKHNKKARNSTACIKSGLLQSERQKIVYERLYKSYC